ncbi:MAG: hypothetical protein AB1756_03830 [Acidobacteriota bacterium]
MKECFGKIIKDSKKMEECRWCEFLEECKAINWQISTSEDEQPNAEDASDGIQDHSSISG